MKSTDARSRLTTWILWAMGLGVACGLLIHFAVRALGPEHAVAQVLLQGGVDGLLTFLGQGFLRLLTVLVVPLVLISLICGTAALEDLRRVGRIGLQAVVFYLGTTALAISLALGAATLLRPGAGFDLGGNLEFSPPPPPPLVETFIQLFPRNVFAAMAEGQMLQIIVFAILFGLAVTLAGDPGKRVLAAFQDWNEVVLKLVQLVMRLAPIGVFGLIARTFAIEGLEALGPLAKYFFVVLGVLLLHGLGTYSLLLALFARLDPRIFLRKMREVQIFAFSTASSNATIPVTLTTVEKKLGVSNPVASFTVPLGATINMDGTAIMQGVATVFIAQAYGISLTAGDLLVVVLTATLASIGTAGVPGVGLVMLSMVLVQAGLPVEGIALIIGIDRLLDMVRTAVNVTGDAVISCIIGRRENEIDLEVFAQKEN
jgi:Na+/H+-dicarboxylate symporter